MIKHYVLKFRFLLDICPMKYHWCNGKHIPDINPKTGMDESGFVDLPPCEYFKDGKCKNPCRKVK